MKIIIFIHDKNVKKFHYKKKLIITIVNKNRNLLFC